jgi:NitT/TauT family transport system substrate-binding protein
MRKNRLSLMLTFLLTISVVLGACTPAAPQPSSPSEPVTLRLALLQILDSLAIYVADREGLFEANGVRVEFIPVASAPERDQLIAAGQADGMVNELLSTMFYNKDQVQVQTVRYARAATSSVPLFSILASGSSGIDSLEELKGVEIGVSQGTIIEYLTDRLLEAEGFQPADIRVVAVPRLTDRLTLLGSGELKAGMLPEPLSSLAALQGAQVILDDSSHPEYSFSTITFRKAVIDSNPEAVRGFLKAVEEAVARINANPEQYSQLMSELNLLPAPLVGQFAVPQFGTAGVPTQAQWDDTLTWAKEKGLITRDIPYTDSVRSDLLP